MKKLLLVLIISLLLISTASACSTVGNSSLEIKFDKVFLEDPEAGFTITFESNDNQQVFSVPQDGNLTIEEIKKGSYDVTINRMGAIEQSTVNINKRHISLDYRLFYDVKGSILEGTHYIISSPAQWLNLAKMADCSITINYYLNNNIDFNNATIPSIASFNGKLDGRYYGITTGAGYKLSNFVIDEKDADNVGLIRENHGEIRNLIIDKATIKGRDNVGVIVGYNYGIISNCDIISGTINANNYAGGIVGIDRGSISTSYSTATIICQGYFGRIAGISYSNMTLGAYGIRPSTAGKTAITAEMSYLDKYLTAIDNWYALDSRAVLQTAEVNVDVTKTVKAAINQIKSSFANFSLEQMVLNIIGSRDFHATEVLIMRRIYEGSYEEGLQRLLVSGGGYTKATSFDSILATLATIPQIKQMLDQINIQFPFGFAVYYDEENDERIELQMTQDAYVASDNTVSYTLGEEVYTFNITNDLIMLAPEFDLNQEDLNKIFAYIAEAKVQMLELSTLDLKSPNAVKSIKDYTYSNGIYKYTMVIDPNIAYKYVFDRIQLAMDTELAGTIGEGTTIEAIFAKDIELIVEIWDNANLKSVRLNNLDVEVIVNLTSATQKYIKDVVAGIDFNNDGKTGDVKNFTMTTVSAKVSGRIWDNYSYSMTDTDIDIYLPEFDKEKISIAEMILESPEEEPA